MDLLLLLKDSFKTTGNSITYLGEDNEEAIAVYDYLHTSNNLPYYKEDNEEFGEIVRKALNGGTYEVIDTNIPLGDTNLRLKNLKPIKSDIFKEYKDEDGLPVVMGGGLWSDITAWNDLGSELSDEGFNVFLIEITGGPDMECDTCTDYTYDFLTDQVYPTYVNEVKSLTGKSKIKYVGHSNGARVALDSLTKGEVNPNDVDTLVLVGVPGNFSELSYFAYLVNQSGDDAIQRIRDYGLNHVTFSRISHEIGTLVGDFFALLKFKENDKISLNLFEQYFNWINGGWDEQPGKNLDINEFVLIYGTNPFGIKKQDDGIVAVSDELAIFNYVNANKKSIHDLNIIHTGMPKNDKVKDITKKAIE